QARQVKRIIAVATAAVRQAANGRVLVDRILQQTGVPVQVLSGEEEASLGYIGLVNSTTETTGLMADLGGGSLKLVGFTDRLSEHSVARDFGAPALVAKDELGDRPRAECRRAFEAFLDETFAQRPW